MSTMPTNLERAARAAVALDMGPERVVENAVRAVLYASRDSALLTVLDPEEWLNRIRRHIPPKPRLTLLRGCRGLPRVWCPELSVLDCEVDGERWVWSVPARAANDVEADHGAALNGALPAENKPKSSVSTAAGTEAT